MDVGAVCERVRGVASVRAAAGAGSASRAELQGGLRSVAAVRSWLAAAEAQLAAALAGCASFPEQAIAEAGRGSQGEAGRVLERSGTLGATPALAGALNDGSVTPGHVDAVTKAAKGLEGQQRAELMRRADGLVGLAAAASVGDFRKRLEHEARSIQRDDGMAKFERQKAAVRLRRWTDADGMWCLQGRFDPLTGVKLNARLVAEIEALFAESVPAGCPTDPVAKQEFLAAWALARIIEDGGVAPRAGRPEFIVVIDTSDDPGPAASGDPDGSGRSDGSTGSGGSGRPGQGEPDLVGSEPGGSGPGGPTVDWGLPVEVPHRVLVELFGEADVHTVIVRHGVVLYAPGELNLGRTTRLANRAQRRALRALYRGCAVPGCEACFDRCKIHHVRWWRHGGRTDLDNLLPLCALHHCKVHSAGWVVMLGPDRQLTIRYPDGTVQATGPPRRRAA
ncbi:MAG: HNH endonuclease signature motif containing protein [Ilumatobacteraceae bacterium]